MIGRRKSPDGLPFNLHKYVGKRIISFGYKAGDNKWVFRLRAPKVNKEKVAEIRAEAIRRANEINGNYSMPDTAAYWIEQYFIWQDGLLRTDERRKADSTLKENKREAKAIEAFFGKMTPITIKPMHVYEYLDMRAQMDAPAKANKEIALLSAVLEFTRRKGVIEQNPCKDIDYNPTRPNNRLVTQGELDFMLTIARERGGQFLVIGLCAQAAYLITGRPEETLKLRRQDLKPDGVKIAIGKRKAGQAQKVRTINWSPKLRAVTDEALSIQRTSGMFVFGNKNGQPYNRNSWANKWKPLMDYCEVAAKQKNIEFERFTLRDMRPKAVTKRKSAGDTNVQDATGHSDSRMIEQTYDRRRDRRVDATE